MSNTFSVSIGVVYFVLHNFNSIFIKKCV